MTSTIASCDLPPGWRLVTYHSLDSTNAELKRLVAAQPAQVEGLIVRADAQTAGRGRHGRTWASPPGNLYASFLVAATDTAVAAQIGFVAAVAVIDALTQIASLPLRCKWPNDVLLDGKKLCGILPEMVMDNAGKTWVVLGIGLNLQPVQLPDAAYPIASLAEHGVVASPEAVVRILAPELAHRLNQWRERGFAPTSDAWAAAGPRLGEIIAVRMPGANGAVTRGRFRALDDDGALLIDVDGTIKRVLAGEVLFERPPSLQAGVG